MRYYSVDWESIIDDERLWRLPGLRAAGMPRPPHACPASEGLRFRLPLFEGPETRLMKISQSGGWLPTDVQAADIRGLWQDSRFSATRLSGALSGMKATSFPHPDSQASLCIGALTVRRTNELAKSGESRGSQDFSRTISLALISRIATV